MRTITTSHSFFLGRQSGVPLQRSAILALLLASSCTSHNSEPGASETAPVTAAAGGELPESLEQGFAEPGQLELQFIDEASGAGLSAHVYVWPKIEDPRIHEAVAERMGQKLHKWYGEGGPSSYSSLTSDDGGQLLLTVPSGLDFELDAWSRNSEFGTAAIFIPALKPGETRLLQVAFSDLPDLEFWGRLTSAGSAVAHAQIEFLEYGSATGDTIESNADGFFLAKVRSWNRPQVSIQAAGCGPVIVNTIEGHTTLENALSIRIRRAAVVDLVGFADAGSLRFSAALHELPYRIDYHLGTIAKAWTRDVDLRPLKQSVVDLPPGVDFELILDDRSLGTVRLREGAQDLELDAEGRVRVRPKHD